MRCADLIYNLLMLKKLKESKEKKLNPERTSPSYIPKDYSEFIELWSERIDKSILRFKLPREEREDLKQDILLEFIERDYINKIFDSSKSQFATFVYNFVNTRVLRRACALTKDQKKFVTNNETESGTEDVNENQNMLSRPMDSRLPDTITSLEKAMWKDAFKKSLDALEKIPVRGTFLKKDGRLVIRSLRFIFLKLALGYDKEQIAEELGYSLANITFLINDLRKVKEIAYLREVYHDIVNKRMTNLVPHASLGLEEAEKENFLEEVKQLGFFNLNLEESKISEGK